MQMTRFGFSFSATKVTNEREKVLVKISAFVAKGKTEAGSQKRTGTLEVGGYGHRRRIELG